jgi:hypothetical protein
MYGLRVILTHGLQGTARDRELASYSAGATGICSFITTSFTRRSTKAGKSTPELWPRRYLDSRPPAARCHPATSFHS